MFGQLIDKLNSFGAHHQMLVALIIAFAIVCVSWGIEKIFEEYVFPHKPWYGYCTVIILGLFLLWLTKHIILHVL